MNKKVIIPKYIVTNNKEKAILKNHCIIVENNIIVEIKKYNENDFNEFKGEVVKAEDLILIPGFVQTHIHLCQTLFRGLADDLELLDWLQYRIFPFENSHSKKSLAISAKLGINELLMSGTTTFLDMGTLRHQEVIFEELISSGIRAIAGKCMMDFNELYPSFKSTTEDEIKYTRELAEAFHNKENERIKYGFAPRFALSATEKLMLATKEMMKDFEGSIFHTHSSENKTECNEVRRLYNKNNVELFDSLGLLDEKTVLAHCIHLSDDEVQLLKKKNANISHCPSSNLKLGSGVADVPKYMKEGINVSLGADGAPCNNTLSVFKEMHLSSLIQKPIHGPTSMNAGLVFEMATLNGAKALGLEKEIGSIEPGKKADLVLLNLNKVDQPVLIDEKNIYSTIVYSASKENVDSVMVEGKWLVQNGKSLIYDEKDLLIEAKEELSNILNCTP